MSVSGGRMSLRLSRTGMSSKSEVTVFTAWLGRSSVSSTRLLARLNGFPRRGEIAKGKTS